MSVPSLTIEQVLTLLPETPPRIAEITTGLAPDRLHTPPGPDEWSANDVLAHLRCCADVWGDSIAKILARDTPVLRAVSPRGWIKTTNYPDQEFQLSLRALTSQRSDLLAVLRPLPHESWHRRAIVKRSGASLEETVLTYAAKLAAHEQSHLEQFQRIANALRAG